MDAFVSQNLGGGGGGGEVPGLEVPFRATGSLIFFLGDAHVRIPPKTTPGLKLDLCRVTEGDQAHLVIDSRTGIFLGLRACVLGLGFRV